MGAKTYALKLSDGCEVVKAKGVTVNRSCDEILNFESMKKIVLDFIEKGSSNAVLIPQVNFVYKFGEGISTEMSWKGINMRKEELKGNLFEKRIYPFGYSRYS